MMKKTLILPALCVSFLTGCISLEPYAPELRATNNDMHVWDTEKSTAWNLIDATIDDHKMRDSDRPKGQSFSQSAAGRNINDIINYSLFGFSGLFLGGNRSSKWYRPHYILLEEKTGAAPSLNYNQFMEVFTDKFSESLSHEPGLQLKSYTTQHIYNDLSGSTAIFLEGDVCLDSGQAYDLSQASDKYKEQIIYGPVEQTGLACEISVVVGKVASIEKDNTEYWAYNLNFFVSNVAIRKALFENAQYFDGFAAFPVKYITLANGEPNFPIVFEGETLHYFIKPE